MTRSSASGPGARPNHFSDILAMVPSFFMQSSTSCIWLRSATLSLRNGAAQCARVSLNSRSATNCEFLLAAYTMVVYAASKNSQFVADLELSDTRAHWAAPFRKDSVALRNQMQDVLDCMKKDGTI